MRGTHLGRRAKATDAKELRVMVGKAGVPVGVVDHGSLVGLTDDDHTQYVHISANRSVTAQHTFAPTTPQPPFVLGINAWGQTVIGLQADRLNKVVTAGNGLTGGGVLTDNIALSLNTPGTLNTTTTNNAAGNHTHAITSSANPGATQSLLRTDSSGYLRLRGLGIETNATTGNLMLANGGAVGVAGGGQAIFDTNDRVEIRTHLRLSANGSDPVDFLYNSGGRLTIQATGDIELGPDGDDVLPTTAYEKNLGMFNRKWLTIHAAELWVQTLVAQEVVATIGGRIIVAPTTVLEADLAASVTSVPMKHNQARRQDILYMEGGGKVEFMRVDARQMTAINAANDWFAVAGNVVSEFPAGHVLFIVESTGGTLDGAWTIASAVYNGGLNRTEITVTESVPLVPASGYILYTAPAANTAPFTYLNVGRNRDGSGSNNWFAGDAIVNMGTAGDGFIDIYSTNGVTAGSTFGPTIVGNVRNSSSIHNDWNEVWAIGNLNGLYGYSADTYGVGLGKYANGNAHMVIDPTFGIQMRSRNGGVNNTSGWWFPSGDIILGPIETNKANLFWDVSEGRLNIRGGNLGIEVAAYIDQDGSIVAGNGDVRLNQLGLTFLNIPTGGLIPGNPVALKFNYGASNEVARMDVYEQEVSGTPVETNVDITSKTVSTASGKRAAVYLRAYSGIFGNSTGIRLETTHNVSSAHAIRFELASVNFASFKGNDFYTNGGILIGGSGDGSGTAPEDGYLVFYNGGSYRKLRVNGSNLEFWNGLAWRTVAFV